MWNALKTFFILLMLLFFLSEFTAERLRNLGDKTSAGICYRLADMADVVKETADSIFEGIHGFATERVNSWRSIAKKETSCLPLTAPPFAGALPKSAA